MATRVPRRLRQSPPLRPLLAAWLARAWAVTRAAVTRGRALTAAGTVLLAVAGYFLLYQGFLHQASLADLTRETDDEPAELMRYDGVADFPATRLGQMQSLRAEYRVPNVVGAGIGTSLEMFVRVDGLEARTRSPGRLRITQGRGSDAVVIDLRPQELQRVSMPWNPSTSEDNEIDIRYQATTDGGRDLASVGDIQLAVEVGDVGLWPYALVFGVLGLGLLAAGVRSPTAPSLKLTGIVGGSVLVMAILHSGGMLSNVLFDGDHGHISGMGRQLLEVGESGSFGDNIYRGTGFSIVPLLTAAIEGKDGLDYMISQVYPTSRYVFFLWVAASLGVLLVSLYRNIAAAVALVVGLLYASFFPFIVDIYRPDADAYFIPLFTVVVAAFLYYRRSTRLFPASAWVMAITLLVMMSVKVTPAFLIFLIPLAVFAQTAAERRTWRAPRAAALLGAFLVAAVIGNTLSTAFYPETRNVGVAGVEFQDHVVWHILWAAAGRFEANNPHGFVKSGDLRRDAVSEVTGLPADVTYLHQSQLATEQLYRPGFTKMLEERPGFYYGTSALRAYERGTYIYRYDGVPFTVELTTRGATQLINRDEMWKVAPTFFLARFVTKGFTLPLELLILSCAVLGILALRRIDLIVLLAGCILAEQAFISLVHVQDRYMNFTNVALLIGLGVFVVVVLRMFWHNARTVTQAVDVRPPASWGADRGLDHRGR